MKIYNISEINSYLKSKFLQDEFLQKIMLRGEISNFKCHSSGHCYFTLKDDKANIHAVMFKSAASKLRFAPQNGMLVIVKGSINVYERDGAYQIYVEGILPEGIGELTIKYEQLKEKLQKEGYFDQKHKRKLPLKPKCIGIVTSLTGAVLHDIFNVSSLRDASVKLLLCPTQVQGDLAAGQIAKAIEKLNNLGLCDVLIVGRGGGSMEDLWAFNEEIVVKAIYNSKIPVVTAIGHETDFTLSDFVADKRAATPSQAAEFCVPKRDNLLEKISSLEKSLSMVLKRKLNLDKVKIDNACQSIKKSLDYKMKEKRQMVENSFNVMKQSTKANLSNKEFAFIRLSEKYENLDPKKVLKRGYSILYHLEQPITTINQLRQGDEIKGYLKNGSFIAKIIKTDLDE